MLPYYVIIATDLVNVEGQSQGHKLVRFLAAPHTNGSQTLPLKAQKSPPTERVK